MFLGDGFLGGGADEVHAVAVFFDNRRRLMHARKLKAYGWPPKRAVDDNVVEALRFVEVG